MNVFIKVYQIDPQSPTGIAGALGITDVEEVEVTSLPAIKKTLEERGTVFRMDEFPVQAEWLPESFFSEDNPERPYVLEAQAGSEWDAPDARCIFYGPIEAKSISYDHRTRVTAYTALSWDAQIEASAPIVPRDTFEAKVARNLTFGGARGGGDKALDLVGLGDPAGIVQRGAVVQVDGKVGDDAFKYSILVTGDGVDTGETVEGFPVYRAPVQSSIGPELRVDLPGPFYPSYRVSEDVLRSPQTGEIISQSTSIHWNLRVLHLPSESWGGAPEELIGARIQLEVDYDVMFESALGPGYTRSYSGVIDAVVEDAEEVVYGVLGSTLDDPEQVPTIALRLSEAWGDGDSTTPSLAESRFGYEALQGASAQVYRLITIEAGATANLLGASAYGTGDATWDPYDTPDLLAGMGERVDGLGPVLEATPIVRGQPAPITRLLAIPDEPIDAFSQICRSAEVVASFVPMSGSVSSYRLFGGARRAVLLIQTREYLANQSPVELPESTDWSGELLGEEPKAVVVRGADPVNVATGASQVYGWWPVDAIEDPSTSSMRRVIEVEAPLVVPSLPDSSFVAEKNNALVRGIARRFWRVLGSYYREQSVTIPAVLDQSPSTTTDEPLLGRRVSGNAEDVLATGIVVEQSVDYLQEETTLKLWVSTDYTPGAGSVPVAHLAAPAIVETGGPEGDGAVVRFSAMGSYDPNGDPIEISWFINGDPQAGETSRILEAAVFDFDVIRVEARDDSPSSAYEGTDTWWAEHTIRVVPTGRIPVDPGEPPLLLVETDQDASDAVSQVFSLTAAKTGAVVSIEYETRTSGVEASGLVATSTDAASGLLPVDRPSPGSGVVRTLRVRAVDTGSGVATPWETYVVSESDLPQIVSASLDTRKYYTGGDPSTARGRLSVYTDDDVNRVEIRARYTDADGGIEYEYTSPPYSVLDNYVEVMAELNGGPREGSRGVVEVVGIKSSRAGRTGGFDVYGPPVRIFLNGTSLSYAGFSIEGIEGVEFEDPQGQLSFIEQSVGGSKLVQISLPQGLTQDAVPRFHEVEATNFFLFNESTGTRSLLTGGGGATATGPEGSVQRHGGAGDLVGTEDLVFAQGALSVAMGGLGGQVHVSGDSAALSLTETQLVTGYDIRLSSNGVDHVVSDEDGTERTAITVDTYTGNVGIGGAMSGDDALRVVGDARVVGAIRVGASLGVDGPATLSGGAFVSNMLDVDGAMWVSGVATMAGSARVRGDLVPDLGYAPGSLGTPTNPWLSANIMEIRAATLVTDEQQVTSGGRLLIGPGSSTLTRDVLASATVIHVRKPVFAVGATLRLESRLQVEYLRVTSAHTQVGAGEDTEYRYDVVRNLDGTGPNDWLEGDSVFSTGRVGEGFIDLYAVRSLYAQETIVGPAIAFRQRESTAWSDTPLRAVTGRLDGTYDYGSGLQLYGVAAGDYGAAWFAVDPERGVRIMHGTDTALRLSPDGSALFRGRVEILAGFYPVQVHYEEVGLMVGAAGAPSEVATSFTSPVAGSAMIRVRLYDAEGGVDVEFDGARLGTASAPNDQSVWFEYEVDWMSTGAHVVSVVDNSDIFNDGVEVQEVEVLCAPAEHGGALPSIAVVEAGLADLSASLGGMAFEDQVELARLGATVISGGYIATNLVAAQSIVAGAITTAKVSTGAITADKLSVSVASISDLFAENATIDRSLTIASAGGVFGDGFRVSSDGFSVDSSSGIGSGSARNRRSFTVGSGGQIFSAAQNQITVNTHQLRVAQASIGPIISGRFGEYGILIPDIGSGPYPSTSIPDGYAVLYVRDRGTVAELWIADEFAGVVSHRRVD